MKKAKIIYELGYARKVEDNSSPYLGKEFLVEFLIKKKKFFLIKKKQFFFCRFERKQEHRHVIEHMFIVINESRYLINAI